MVQVPGQHSIMYAANADGILACSTEHKDGCQMVQGLNSHPDYKSFDTYRTMGYFLANDGRKFIYSAGKIFKTENIYSQAFWLQVIQAAG
jgi:hypothetical protein